MLGKPPIDHASAAPFPATAPGPAQLPESAPAGNHRSGIGRCQQGRLKRTILFIVQRLQNTLREDRRLNDDHGTLYANGACPDNSQIGLRSA